MQYTEFLAFFASGWRAWSARMSGPSRPDAEHAEQTLETVVNSLNRIVPKALSGYLPTTLLQYGVSSELGTYAAVPCAVDVS